MAAQGRLGKSRRRPPPHRDRPPSEAPAFGAPRIGQIALPTWIRHRADRPIRRLPTASRGVGADICVNPAIGDFQPW